MLSLHELATPIVGPVSLTIPAGDCCVVQGASGAGKSLLLRAIADLDPATGEVTLDGTPRARWTAPDWRRQVALVPANSGWWAADVAAHFDEAASDRTARLLEALGLSAALGWEVARLSTGERQRLALVRALAHQPRALLLDEPTAALDTGATAAVEALVGDCLAQGMAVLLITHDAAQAARLGDRRYEMAQGRLMEAAW